MIARIFQTVIFGMLAGLFVLAALPVLAVAAVASFFINDFDRIWGAGR